MGQQLTAAITSGVNDPAIAPYIAVMGMGMVGGAYSRYLADLGIAHGTYDPPKGLTDRSALRDAEIIFVCVPTPYYLDGDGFDDSYLREAFDAIPGRGKIVVIKSTVLPGTTARFQELYPQHKVLFNPEFLTEATADKDTREPKRQIIGSADRTRDAADLVLTVLPKAPFTAIVTAEEAEMVKYMCNTFYALKVAHANQVYDVCERMGIDYDQVARCAGAEPMMGTNHLQVKHKGYRGYGGKCLPKDVRAFIQLARRQGLVPTLLEAAEAYNNRLVASQGLDIRWKEGSPARRAGAALRERARHVVRTLATTIGVST